MPFPALNWSTTAMFYDQAQPDCNWKRKAELLSLKNGDAQLVLCTISRTELAVFDDPLQELSINLQRQTWVCWKRTSQLDSQLHVTLDFPKLGARPALHGVQKDFKHVKTCKRKTRKDFVNEILEFCILVTISKSLEQMYTRCYKCSKWPTLCLPAAWIQSHALFHTF